MSSAAADESEGSPPPEWNRLELAARRLLDDYEGWRRRARTAEARIEELEGALADVSSGTVDPIALARRVEQLSDENEQLRKRLAEADESVGRILARLDFLEEER